MLKFLALMTFFSLSVSYASVEAEGKYQHPSDAEIQRSRACFQDLEVQGCSKQEEDPVQFQECLSNVLDKLDADCQKMMLELYGDK